MGESVKTLAVSFSVTTEGVPGRIIVLIKKTKY